MYIQLLLWSTCCLLLHLMYIHSNCESFLSQNVLRVQYYIYLLLLSDECDDATVPSPCQVSPRSRSTWPRLLVSRAGGTSPLLLCLGRTLFPLGEGGVGPCPGGSDGRGVARIDTREGAEVFEDLCHGAGRAFLTQVQQVTDPLCCQQLWRKTLDL